MRQLNEHHSFTGMQKDMSISKHPTSFLYNARNIRLTSRGDNTLLAVTNEKGTENTDIEISGTYLGHCLLNQFLIIFSTDTEDEKPDYITRIDLDGLSSIILYNGNLDFNEANPIEAIGYFENSNVQKVYWVDGKNQPRMINIADSRIENRATLTDYSPFTDKSFNFITELALNEKILINKQISGEGMFSAGVIQYAFTYYNKYGQESNIFYTSPLLYISHPDRGSSPEEKVSNSFKIDIYDVDHNYDYLRIYSIQRTSLNGTPIVKRVSDLNINSSSNVLSYIDAGTQGDAIDPTELLYKGGEEIIAGTLEQKDNTLFFGNITLKRDSIQSIIANLAERAGTTIQAYLNNNVTIEDSYELNNETRKYYRTLYIERSKSNTNAHYSYGNQLMSKTVYGDITIGNQIYSNLTKSTSCAGFKYGDVYRFGIQFQHVTGIWSEPIFIKDIEIKNHPIMNDGMLYNESIFPTEVELKLPILKGTIKQDLAKAVKDKDYIRVRALVVYPTLQDRNVICQGVACPTVKHLNQYQSSWFYRPRLKEQEGVTDGSASYPVLWSPSSGADGDDLIYDESDINDVNSFDPHDLRRVEIQGRYTEASKCKINTNILTLNSPDIEYDTDLQLFNYSVINVKKVGEAGFRYTTSDIDIQTETPSISNDAAGFTQSEFLNWYNGNRGGYAGAGRASKGIIAGAFYNDWLVDDADGGFVKGITEQSAFKWFVYPWHRSGSLNNDIERPTGQGTRSALLKKKIISNARYSATYWRHDATYWKDNDDVNYDYTLGSDHIPSPSLFNHQEMAVAMMGGEPYLGNVDTLLQSDLEDSFYFMFGSNAFSAPNISTPINAVQYYWRLIHDTLTAGAQSIYLYNSGNSRWDYSNIAGVGDVYPKLSGEKSMVRMKYKSSPHLIFINNPNNSILENDLKDNVITSTLPIVEFRQNVSSDTRFGGTSEDALKSNLWIPCGEPVKIPDNSYVFFDYVYGDTYFQRWDCLKTYAFAPDDVNQVIEIGSFQLESHINLDGRYDKNRGMSSNLHMSSQNFNLINPVYSQINNFFTYRILDEGYYKQEAFPNQIIWSKEKKAGAKIDLWTNITLASTYDMDGTKGTIVSLNTWRDKLFCFQDKGVSNILFNSRVQIPASDGIPIEISNSYKVDGYRYISDGVGCANKFLIKETPAGIYFIDSITNHLYHISDSIQDVTVTHNMSSWFDNSGTIIKKLLYDEVHRDLYVTEDLEALCFSEILGQFTAFMDYTYVDLIESRNSRVFSLSNKTVYEMFVGPYNQLFTNTVDWELTFISNGIDNNTQDFDKVFTTIDYRLDVFDSNNEYKADDSLSTIRVTNEYQDTTEVTLSRLKVINNPKSYHHNDTNLQKKFRIWRIQIPRDNIHKLDRIRNPWCKITLKGSGTNNRKAVLQDLNVQYYI